MWQRAGVMAVALALVGGCGDDGGGGDGAALGDDPTAEECIAAIRTMSDRFSAPDVDVSDGVDDAEAEAIDAAMRDAADGLFDPDDLDHPCNERIEALAPAEIEALLGELDPEFVEILGANARQEFEAIEDEL